MITLTQPRRTVGLLLSISMCLTPLIIAAPASAQRIIDYNAAIDIAMENSPNILQTKLDLERSRELLNAQNAALKSSFRLNLNPFSLTRDQTFNKMFSVWTENKTNESNGSFSITQPIVQTDGTLILTNRLSWQDNYTDYTDVRNKTFNNSLYMSFTQPIFTYNVTKQNLKELELDLENTELSFALQKLSIERQTANSFYSVYQAKMSLDVAKEELVNQQQSYDIIKNKVDAGLAALEELYQAELNLASSKSTVQNREVSLENAYDSFKVDVGIPLDESIVINADVSYQLVPVELQKAIDTALANRLELRQREISLENAQFDLIRTKASNEFKGNITLSYGLTGTQEDFMEMYDKPTQKQSVGIALEVPLWDWGEKASRVKASEASIKRQKISIDDERNNIIISIRQSIRDLTNLVTQIEIAEQNVKNAQLTYEINLERYRNGDLTSMDLSLFQNQLSQKKTALVQALISYKLALLDLKIQALWDFEKNAKVLPLELIEKQ